MFVYAYIHIYARYGVLRVGATINYCPPRGQQLHQSVGIRQLYHFREGMRGFTMDVSDVC